MLTSMVRGRLYKNYSTRKFIARNIFNMKIWRFTVYYVPSTKGIKSVGHNHTPPPPLYHYVENKLLYVCTSTPLIDDKQTNHTNLLVEHMLLSHLLFLGATASIIALAGGILLRLIFRNVREGASTLFVGCTHFLRGGFDRSGLTLLSVGSNHLQNVCVYSSHHSICWIVCSRR